MFLVASRAERAKSPVVMRTGGQFRLRVDVQVETLVAVGAVAVAHEEVALGHLAQVVLVQELARFSLLAEPAEPVLADQGAKTSVAGAAGGLGGVGRSGDMALGAVGSEGTVAGLVGFADWSVGREGVLVGLLEKGGECEGVGGELGRPTAGAVEEGGC